MRWTSCVHADRLFQLDIIITSFCLASANLSNVERFHYGFRVWKNKKRWSIMKFKLICFRKLEGLRGPVSPRLEFKITKWKSIICYFQLTLKNLEDIFEIIKRSRQKLDVGMKWQWRIVASLSTYKSRALRIFHMHQPTGSIILGKSEVIFFSKTVTPR